MKVKELCDRQKGVDVDLKVLDVIGERDYHGAKKSGKVITAVCTDGETQCDVSIWDKQIDELKKKFEKNRSNTKLKVRNGYCKFYTPSPEVAIKIELTPGMIGNIIIE